MDGWIYVVGAIRTLSWEQASKQDDAKEARMKEGNFK